MLSSLLFNAGRDPGLSWKRFKIGMCLFAIGMSGLYFAPNVSLSLYWIGLIVLLSGFGMAMWGYWGIFANRFSRLLYQRQINQVNDPFANPDKTDKRD